MHRAEDLSFFPEEDDNQELREGYSNENLNANEYLYRRVDMENVMSAHRSALERAPDLRFGIYRKRDDSVPEERLLSAYEQTRPESCENGLGR